MDQQKQKKTKDDLDAAAGIINSNSYDPFPETTMFDKLFSPKVILSIAGAIVILVGGGAVFISIFRIVNQPVIAGSVPMWAVILGGLVLFKFLSPPPQQPRQTYF